MIDLYFWTTPNGYKVPIFFEEAGLPYQTIPVNISKGEQFKPDFLKVSPNNRIPAIIDYDTDGDPVSVFKSGAILTYLAEKTGKFLPADAAKKADVLQWLFWQVGGIGPMLGQNMHFTDYAPEVIPYAIDRYARETRRLYRALDRQLADKDYVAGDYSIADMALYPWVRSFESRLQSLDRFPNLRRWAHRMAARPAVIRAYAKGRAINTTPTVSEESKAILMGQDAGPVLVPAQAA